MPKNDRLLQLLAYTTVAQKHFAYAHNIRCYVMLLFMYQTDVSLRCKRSKRIAN